MKRTTITLPDELATLVEREARRRRVSVSQVTREALESRFRASGRRKLPFMALGRSGYRGTARNMEEILAEEWAPDRDR